MFLNIQIDLLILKTYYGQFTLTTKNHYISSLNEYRQILHCAVALFILLCTVLLYVLLSSFSYGCPLEHSFCLDVQSLFY